VVGHYVVIHRYHNEAVNASGCGSDDACEAEALEDLIFESIDGLPSAFPPEGQSCIGACPPLTRKTITFKQYVSKAIKTFDARVWLPFGEQMGKSAKCTSTSSQPNATGQHTLQALPVQ